MHCFKPFIDSQNNYQISKMRLFSVSATILVVEFANKGMVWHQIEALVKVGKINELNVNLPDD